MEANVMRNEIKQTRFGCFFESWRGSAKNRAGFAGGSKPREVEAMTTRYFPEAQARTYRAAVAQTAKALRREI